MKANPVEVFRSKSRLRQWLVIHLTWADFDQAIGDKPCIGIKSFSAGSIGLDFSVGIILETFNLCLCPIKMLTPA